MICLKWLARRDLSVYVFHGLIWSMHHINIMCTTTNMSIKWGQNSIKWFILVFHTHPCHATLLPCKLCIIHHGMIACLMHLTHMLAHLIYVGPCLFGSSSNRRWAGDISREPGALPRSITCFNWAARQALPHACIHIVPIASFLFLHHWVAIALNWIPSIA